MCDLLNKFSSIFWDINGSILGVLVLGVILKSVYEIWRGE